MSISLTTYRPAQSRTIAQKDPEPHLPRRHDSQLQADGRAGRHVRIIYHLAAAVGVRLIVESPVNTIETNIRGTDIV